METQPSQTQAAALDHLGIKIGGTIELEPLAHPDLATRAHERLPDVWLELSQEQDLDWRA